MLFNNIILFVVASGRFLRVFEKLENTVAKRKGFSKKKQKMMLMPKETRQGIEVTGMYFFLAFA